MINDQCSIGDARRYMDEHARQGIQCPLCFGNHKIYKRALNTSIVISLIWMRRYGMETLGRSDILPWIEPQRVGPRNVVTSREYPRAKYWELVEPRYSETTEDAQEKGVWKLTQRGADFVDGKIAVPSHVMVLRGAPLALTREEADAEKIRPVSVTEALGTKFDLKELMTA